MHRSFWKLGLSLLVVCFAVGPVLAQQPNVPQLVPTNTSGMQYRQYNPNVLTVGVGATPAGGPAILYAPSEADDPAYRDAISVAAGGVPVDYFDATAGTPDLALLSNYTCVMTWANFAYADATTYGDNLAAFVDGGGSVILGAFTTFTAGSSLGGAIMTAAYCPVVAPTGGNLFTGSDYDGSGVTPIFTGGIAPVSALNNIYRDDVILQGAGIQDGAWMDGAICAAYRPDFNVIFCSGAGGAPVLGTGDAAQWIANSCDPTVPACPAVLGLTVTDNCPDVDLSWSNGGAYTSIIVRRDGSTIATLPLGTETSYTDTTAGGSPGTYVYSVQGVCGADLAFEISRTIVHCPAVSILYAPSEADDAAFRGALAAATSGVVDYFDTRAATPDAATLSGYDMVITWANFAYLDRVGFGDNLADFADAGGKVVLGSFCTFTAGSSLGGQIMTDCYCPVVSPAGNNLFIFDNYDGSGTTCLYDSVAALGATFRDDIVTQGAGAIDGLFLDGAICAAYNTSGPNVVYANGLGGVQLAPTGDWVQMAANVASVCAGPPSGCSPVTNLACDADCAAGTAAISWDAAAWDSIEITVNGAAEATLPGTATSYSYDSSGVSGTFDLTVTPICAGVAGCGKSCSFVIQLGAVPKHVILALELPADVDSVAALIASLNNLGETDYVVVTDPALIPSSCGGNMIWAMTGTYPSNFVVTPDLGDALTQHILNGGHLHFEGGDTWGFDAPQSWNAYDGVAAGAFDGDDSLLSLEGVVGGPYEGVTGAYFQDQQVGFEYTDQIQAADENGGFSVNAWQIAGGLYVCGTWLSDTASEQTVNCQSWELGGFGTADERDALIQLIIDNGVGGGGGATFKRGDSNGDDGFDISDAVFTLSALFVPGSPAPACQDAADANDDGGLDISDAVYTLSALFVPGAPTTPAPGPAACGTDPTDADPLGCGSHPCFAP